MPIDWSDNENNVKLLAATYAVLGKETFARERCFTDIAARFGDGASYDAIQKRFKTIAAKAETLQVGVINTPRPKTAAHLRKPERPRKRPRSDDTILLEPDDLEIIEQGRFRTPIQPLRSSISHPARSIAFSTDVRLAPDVEKVKDGAGGSHQGQSISLSNIESPGPSSYRVSSPIEQNSNIHRLNMPLEPADTGEERFCQSSQDHADERAMFRQMYMDKPPAKMSKKTSGSAWSPQTEIQEVVPESYIDATNRGCILCKKKWSSLQQALQHERESDLHRANLLIPERVRAANMRFIETYCSPPIAEPSQEDLLRETSRAEATQPSSPAGQALVSNFTASSSPGLSSIVIVDGSSQLEKGKARAKAPVSPKPDLTHAGKGLQRWSTRYANSLPRETVESVQELAKSMIGNRLSATPSTSEYIASSCDEDDEDMNMIS